MFPDMYLQYNHPTNKSRQKPPIPHYIHHSADATHHPDKPQGNSTPAAIHHTTDDSPPPSTPQENSAPAAIQRSADGTPPPGKPQGNSAFAAIQRSADGTHPSGKPPHLTPPKNRTDRLPAGRLHGRAPVRRSKPLVILGA